MNILDIEVKYQIHNYKELLFYAKKQFFKYEEIEGIKNWEEYDFSIDCSEDQLKFKDILEIRFVEELTEMTLAIDNLSHFKEELIDSFNFFSRSELPSKKYK